MNRSGTFTTSFSCATANCVQSVDIWWSIVHPPHGNVTAVGTGIHPDHTSRPPQADRSLQHRSHVATHAQDSIRLPSPVQGFTSPIPDDICCSYLGAIYRKAKEAGTSPVRLMQTSGWRVIIVVTTVLLAWSLTQVCRNTLTALLGILVCKYKAYIVLAAGQQRFVELGQNHNHPDVLPSCAQKRTCWPRNRDLCRYYL